MLAEHGALLVSAGVERSSGTIKSPVTVTPRGWFVGERDKDLVASAVKEVTQVLEEALKKDVRDSEELNRLARRALGRLVGQRFRRQPVLMSSIVVF